jgi:hypothetical protein
MTLYGERRFGVKCIKYVSPKNYLSEAEYKAMKYMIRLKLVNIYPLNLKLTKFSDKDMLLLLCC